MTQKNRPDTTASLRDHLRRHPEDATVRMRLATALAAQGEIPAARAVLAPLSAPDGSALAGQITATLAALDEAEGCIPDAIARWERLLADDIDCGEARAHLTRLKGADGAALDPVMPAPAAPTLFSPEGVTLFRYELVREIGRGATSMVYLARDRALGIELALKILHHQDAGAARACRSFFHQARAVAGLRHPGIVAIYDLDEKARTLVMEYLSGGTLRSRLVEASGHEPPITLGAHDVRSLAEGLLRALAYLHGRGVVHGDITPRNILLRPPSQPVLCDFGSARLPSAGASSNANAGGTPLYCAPEQLRGGPASPRTDLFAVGAVLWEALAGRPLRERADLVAGRFTPAPLPESVRDALSAPQRGIAALIDALTSEDPDKRPGSAEEALRMR